VTFVAVRAAGPSESRGEVGVAHRARRVGAERGHRVESERAPQLQAIGRVTPPAERAPPAEEHADIDHAATGGQVSRGCARVAQVPFRIWRASARPRGQRPAEGEDQAAKVMPKATSTSPADAQMGDRGGVAKSSTPQRIARASRTRLRERALNRPAISAPLPKEVGHEPADEESRPRP